MTTHEEIRQQILDAGIEYPEPTYWNEMGGSEKDLWEERQLRSIIRRESMTATSDAAEVPAKPELTPYDTGEVLEPKLWPATGDDFDRFGRVDFDNDAGETVFTMQMKRDGKGYRLNIDGHHDVELTVSTTGDSPAKQTKPTVETQQPIYHQSHSPQTPTPGAPPSMGY